MSTNPSYRGERRRGLGVEAEAEMAGAPSSHLPGLVATMDAGRRDLIGPSRAKEHDKCRCRSFRLGADITANPTRRPLHDRVGLTLCSCGQTLWMRRHVEWQHCRMWRTTLVGAARNAAMATWRCTCCRKLRRCSSSVGAQSSNGSQGCVGTGESSPNQVLLYPGVTATR
jgi:hypothetical protein